MQRLCKPYAYWHELIKNRHIDELFFGNVTEDRLTKEAIIVYIGFEYRSKSIFKSGWGLHQNVDSLVEYLINIFIPTAFFNWFDEETEGFYVPMSPFQTIEAEVLGIKDNIVIKNNQQKISEILLDLTKILESKHQIKISQIKEICDKMNDLFNEEPFRKITIKCFESASEIDKSIFNSKEFDEVVEEEIGMTKLAFTDLCKNAYNNPFVGKAFISHLNQKIPIWF